MGQFSVKIATAIAHQIDVGNSEVISGFALMQAALNTLGPAPSLGASVAAWPSPSVDTGTGRNGICVMRPDTTLVPIVPTSVLITTSYLVHLYAGGTYRGVASRDASITYENSVFSTAPVPVVHTLYDGASPLATIFPGIDRVVRQVGTTWDGGTSFSTLFPPQAFTGLLPLQTISFGMAVNEFATLDTQTILDQGFNELCIEGRAAITISFNADPIFTDNPQSAASDAYIAISAADFPGSTARNGAFQAIHGNVLATPVPGGSAINYVVPVTALKNATYVENLWNRPAAAATNGYLVGATQARPCSIRATIRVSLSENAVAGAPEPSIPNSALFPSFVY